MQQTAFTFNHYWVTLWFADATYGMPFMSQYLRGYYFFGVSRQHSEINKMHLAHEKM